MTDADDTPKELAGRWRHGLVLKRDVFSTIERGRYALPDGDVDAVLRRIDRVPWWSRFAAIVLFRRERHALSVAGGTGVAPPLLYGGRQALIRGWIDGVALHIAKPHGNREYFRSAKRALRALHRTGLCHNDLAKEQNWLVTADGRARVTDFQLAVHFRRRHRLFRVAAYEDLRHLLKHKQRYVPDAMTPAEMRMLARKSIITRLLMGLPKRLYLLVTRSVFHYTDREGAGPLLAYDAPALAARLRSHPQVRDAVLVAFPDRYAGTGLYAFVEADPGVSEHALRDFLAEAKGRAAPRQIQIVDMLPRNRKGEVRSEILQLVATNQIDQIEPLMADAQERNIVARIVSGRRNLRDRFAY
jgi:hypothetical protein